MIDHTHSASDKGCWGQRDRKRRIKTDRIDGELLVRTLLAYKRGEPRVCAMVRPPEPEDEDRRRLTRERKALMTEAVRHTNRIKGLLYGQGIVGYEPRRRDRRSRLEQLITGDGRPIAPRLKAQIERELERLELVLSQIASCEAERDILLASLTSQADRTSPELPRRRGQILASATALNQDSSA